MNAAIIGMPLLYIPVNGIRGTVGTGAEWLSKLMPNSTAKKAVEIFSKMLQSISAASTLIILGYLYTNPVILIPITFAAIALIASPPSLAAIQLFGTYKQRIWSQKIDNGLSLFSKAFNTASAGFGLIVFTAPVIYIPSIIALSALNAYVFLKE